MPELVRLYLRHTLIGALLGAVFTGLLFWFDVGRLWHLVNATDEGPIAALMLVVFNAIVFAGVQFGWAVMALAERREPPPRGPPAPAGGLTRVVPAAEGGGNRSDRAGVNFPRA